MTLSAEELAAIRKRAAGGVYQYDMAVDDRLALLAHLDAITDPLNGPIAVLRAEVASLSVHVHVHEQHSGDWQDCDQLECTSARAALLRGKP